MGGSTKSKGGYVLPDGPGIKLLCQAIIYDSCKTLARLRAGKSAAGGTLVEPADKARGIEDEIRFLLRGCSHIPDPMLFHELAGVEELFEGLKREDLDKISMRLRIFREDKGTCNTSSSRKKWRQRTGSYTKQ